LGWSIYAHLACSCLACPAPATPVAVAIRELAAFPAGSFLESIKQDRVGNLYISKITGVDLSGADSSSTRGEIVRLSPDGRVSTFATLPPGAFAGVIAIARDDTLYLTVGVTATPQYQEV
jgi:hypothetical protein